MDVGQLAERLWPALAVRVETLGGGLTNHNFKVTAGGEAYVLRVSGKDTDLLGIDRRHEHEAALVAAALGLGPEVVAFVEESGCLVTRFVEGAPIPTETISSADTIAHVAAALRALHDGPRVPGRFDAFRIVEDYRDTILARGKPAPMRYAAAKVLADEIEHALGNRDPCPCHNDLLNANFIADGDRIWIVDWEYAGMGEPFFDLANFAVNNGLEDDGESALLAAYGGDGARDAARLTVMRFMSDFREAMWGAVQAAVSELEVDYEAYADEHFDRLEATAASARFRGSLERVRG